MKVLLINPQYGLGGRGAKRYRRSWPPLDLLSAAALLRSRGHQPEILDVRASGAPPEDIKAAAAGHDLLFLQSTPLDRWQCPDLDLQALKRTAGLLPREKLIVGGAHGTVRPDYILQLTGAMALVRGEPEMTLAALADSRGVPQGVAGVSYPRHDSIIHNPQAPRVVLDDIPPPAYDLVDLRPYRYELLSERLALLETSRGCPFSCRFCLKAVYGPGVSTKSVSRVLSEVGDVLERGARGVYFMDLEFTWDRERAMELCLRLSEMKKDFSWCCQTRVDSVDEELLRGMRAAGCKLIHFGIEAGDPEMLASTGKKITLDQAGRALDLCRRIGISTACFFLMGLPGENVSMMRATARIARELAPDFASFHPAAPYPGTAWGDLDKGNEEFPSNLSEHSSRVLAGEVRRAFLLFYLRPVYWAGMFKKGGLSELIKKVRLFWEFVG